MRKRNPEGDPPSAWSAKTLKKRRAANKVARKSRKENR